MNSDLSYATCLLWILNLYLKDYLSERTNRLWEKGLLRRYWMIHFQNNCLPKSCIPAWFCGNWCCFHLFIYANNFWVLRNVTVNYNAAKLTGWYRSEIRHARIANGSRPNFKNVSIDQFQNLNLRIKKRGLEIVTFRSGRAWGLCTWWTFS